MSFWYDSVSGTWSRLFQSNSTWPEAMSISWALLVISQPFFGPPTDERSAWILRCAVIRAVSCGVMLNSCRSVWAPWPALTLAMTRYEVSAM